MDGHRFEQQRRDDGQLWDQVTDSLADSASFDPSFTFQESMEAVRDMDIAEAMTYVMRRLQSIQPDRPSAHLRLVPQLSLKEQEEQA